MEGYRARGMFRLRGYDYAAVGVYFITICTHHQIHFFGKVRDGRMVFSDAGKIVQEEWDQTPTIRQSIPLTLDAYCVMPNHFHALLVIGSPALSYYPRFPDTSSAPAQFGGAHSQTLGAIVRGFKGSCTRRIHASGLARFRWQKRFHDHIVRDTGSWNRIRQYILNNPRRWEEDRFSNR